MIKLLIFLNALVTLAWFMAGNESQLLWMLNNFTVSWTGLNHGYFWTLLTSVFSHNMIIHLLVNMYVLQGFGGILIEVLGNARFLIFYLTAGMVGSFMHALLSAFILHEPALPALGASGAIAGIILFFSLSFPQEKLLLFGLIPLRAGWAAVLIVGLDLWGLMAQSQGGGLPLGHGAHLGGALVGALYYFFRVKNPGLDKS